MSLFKLLSALVLLGDCFAVTMRAFVIVFESHMVSVVSQWVDCLVLHKWMWLFSHSRRFMEGIDSFNML